MFPAQDAVIRLTLARSLAVSIPAVCVAMLVCFSALAFRDGLLGRTVGSTRAYLVAGLAFPLLAGLPLSWLVIARPAGLFLPVFCVAFVAAVGVMAATLRVWRGRVGGYAAGWLAICCLGSVISWFLNPGSHFLPGGVLLACWTLLGDYAGYNARSRLGGIRGTAAYALTYGLFLGSGLGALLWQTQRHV